MIRLALAAALLSLSASGEAPERSQPRIGEPAPSFSLRTLEGRTVTLADLKGSYAVVHFAATWCPYCNAEAPHLEALHKRYAGRGVQVLIINVQEPVRKVRKWAAKRGLTLPILLDEDGTAAASFVPEGAVPDLSREEAAIASNLIIDPEGRIRFFSLLDSADFDAKLAGLTARLDSLMAGGAEGPAAAEPGQAGGRVLTVGPVEPLSLKPGGSQWLFIPVQVAEGYHVQANPASEDYLIALRLDLRCPEGLTCGPPVYPSSKPFRLKGSDKELDVYDGLMELRLTLSADGDVAPGERTVEGTLRYQACDDRRCLFPATAPVSVPVQVVRAP